MNVPIAATAAPTVLWPPDGYLRRTGVDTVAAGFRHSRASLADGTQLCWATARLASSATLAWSGAFVFETATSIGTQD